MTDDPRESAQDDDTANTEAEQDSTTPGSGSFPSEENAENALPGVPEDADQDDSDDDGHAPTDEAA